MDKYYNNLVYGYKKFNEVDVKVQKTPCAPSTNLRKSKIKEPTYIDKYRSFVGQIMWYTMKVGPDMSNAEIELTTNMIHPLLENCKALGRLIGYTKGK